MTRGRRWFLIAIGGAGGLALLAVVGRWALFAIMFSNGPEKRCEGHRHFSPAMWSDRTLADGPLAVRGCIVDDLLARHDFHGVSRAHVVGLLGEPRTTPNSRDYDLVYWLGPERGPFSVDSELLVFRLDSGGRVSTYRLITD